MEHFKSLDSNEFSIGENRFIHMSPPDTPNTSPSDEEVIPQGNEEEQNDLDQDESEEVTPDSVDEKEQEAIDETGNALDPIEGSIEEAESVAADAGVQVETMSNEQFEQLKVEQAKEMDLANEARAEGTEAGDAKALTHMKKANELGEKIRDVVRQGLEARLKQVNSEFSLLKKQFEDAREQAKEISKVPGSEADVEQLRTYMSDLNERGSKLQKEQGELKTKLGNLQREDIEALRSIEDMENPPKSDYDAHMRDASRAFEDMKTADGVTKKLGYLLKAIGGYIKALTGKEYNGDIDLTKKQRESIAKRRETETRLKKEIGELPQNQQTADGLISSKKEELKDVLSEGKLSELRDNKEDFTERLRKLQVQQVEKDKPGEVDSELLLSIANLKAEIRSIDEQIEKNEKATKGKAVLEEDIKFLEEWKTEMEGRAKEMTALIQKHKDALPDALKNIVVKVGDDQVSLKIKGGSAKGLRAALEGLGIDATMLSEFDKVAGTNAESDDEIPEGSNEEVPEEPSEGSNETIPNELRAEMQELIDSIPDGATGPIRHMQNVTLKKLELFTGPSGEERITCKHSNLLHQLNHFLRGDFSIAKTEDEISYFDEDPKAVLAKIRSYIDTYKAENPQDSE